MQPEQFSSLIAELHKKHKNGAIPADVEVALRAFGSYPSGVTEQAAGLSYYMGKKEPGLAKIFYELGVLPPTEEMIEALREKAGLPILQSDQYRHAKSTAYTEFFFQVLVEKRAPEKFIPLRGQVDSYHKLFQTVFFDKPPVQRPRPFRVPRHAHWPR